LKESAVKAEVEQEKEKQQPEKKNEGNPKTRIPISPRTGAKSTTRSCCS